ncbi:C40 family peptidase [Salinifilum ghardaiensis]
MPHSAPTRNRVAAATALIAVLGIGSPVASAAPDPPENSSEAGQRLEDLTRKAEILTEDYKKAREDHAARERAHQRAESAAARAERTAQRARAEENALRGKVDELTAASYQGARLNQVPALMASGAPEDYLDRAAVLDKLAADNNEAITELAKATRQAEDAEHQARRSRDEAAAAAEKATRLERAIARRKQAMDEQITAVKQQYQRLSEQEQQALSGDSTNVGAIGGSGAAVAAVNAALGKQGSPYVWGAKGPDQFDCSGLVQWSYEQAGVDLPASTRSQVNAGRSVSQGGIKPGDVIFYYSSASHNAIYIGNGQAVHAPTEGEDVKVDDYQDIGDVHSIRRVVG